MTASKNSSNNLARKGLNACSEPTPPSRPTRSFNLPPTFQAADFNCSGRTPRETNNVRQKKEVER